MNSPVTIQLAQPEHLPEVHRMMNALAAHHHRTAMLTPYELQDLVFGHPDTRLLVAHLQNSLLRHPVGYALLVRRASPLGQAYAVVQWMVQGPLQGQGIGRALIDAAAELAQSEQIAETFIASEPDLNPCPVERFAAA